MNAPANIKSFDAQKARADFEILSRTVYGKPLVYLDSGASAQKPRMVLDFGNVAHMSSSALGVLITLNKRVRERKGELRLCNIQPAIYEIFVITRLNEIFQICPTRQEAIDSLR